MLLVRATPVLIATIASACNGESVLPAGSVPPTSEARVVPENDTAEILRRNELGQITLELLRLRAATKSPNERVHLEQAIRALTKMLCVVRPDRHTPIDDRSIDEIYPTDFLGSASIAYCGNLVVNGQRVHGSVLERPGHWLVDTGPGSAP